MTVLKQSGEWTCNCGETTVADPKFNVVYTCNACTSTYRITSDDKSKEEVSHPAHYGGADNPYETIKVLEAWGLIDDAYLFNCIKYVSRAGKKGDALTDLKKAAWYLNRKIAKLESAK